MTIPGPGNIERSPPHTPAPYVSNAALRISALCAETLSIMLPSEIGISVSPLKYQLKSASPPSPKPLSGLSFGPATKPSNDTVMLKTTFPMETSFPRQDYVVCLRNLSACQAVTMNQRQ